MEETTQAATTNEGETSTSGDQSAGGQPQTEATEVQEQTEQQETQPLSAPEKYELKPMEGREFDSEFLKTYEDVARELDLSNDKAQKMIDKMAPLIEKQQLAKIAEVQEGWANTSKADKEFGGDKLDENLSVAKQALDKFGTPELKQLINETGIGNHPEVIRFFYRAGKAISQDTFVGGQQSGKAAPRNFNEFADALYK